MIFSGSFFLFETIVSMRWTDIRSIRHDDGGLVVTMRKKEEHVFLKVPKNILSRLIYMQNEALSSRRTCSTTTSSADSITSITLDDDDEEGDEYTACRTLSTSVTSLADRLPDSLIEKHTGLPFALKHIAVVQQDDLSHGSLSAGPNALVFTGKRYYWDHVILVLPWDSVRDIQNDDDGCIRIVSFESLHEYRWMVSDPQSNQEVWETLIACHNEQLTKTPAKPKKSVKDEIHLDGEQLFSSSKPAQLEHVVVTNVEIPCSLQDFDELFLRDNAKHSLASFLESRGDSDLETSDWNNDSSRVVRYLHPVKAPMAPPQARARKEQRLLRPNEDSIVVETKTIVDDVPMTDCFYVLDRIHIERNGPKVVKILAMEFEIKFVKSTMFQGIIRKTTAKEFTAMFQSLADFYRNAADPDSNIPATVTIPTTVEASKVELQQYLLWGVTIALQIWILVELRDLKASMAK